MKKDDIEHLAKLSHISLTDEEMESLQEDLASILSYVDQVKEVSSKGGDHPVAGDHRNIMRDDTSPHEPGIYTDKLLSEAPETEKGYIKVKKIL